MGYKYAGPFRYQLVLGDAFLESCPAAGGRFWCLDGETDPDAYLLDPSPRYFLSDYLGNTRAIVNDDGALSMQADYQPYGRIIYRLSPYEENNSYLWTGKEQQTPFFETSWYDSGARFLTTNGFFFSPDPLAEEYPGVSPYAYCKGDPVNLIDYNGKSTWVTANSDGTYEVCGGDVDDGDLSVYVVHKDNGVYIKDYSIGVTPTITSFYESESKEWQIGSVINLNDVSGMVFLSDTINNPPSLQDYITNAQNGHKYDFKATNGQDSIKEELDYYRGMPIGNGVIASARDIGNIGAGFMSGVYGIPYILARMAFDAYETYTATIDYYEHHPYSSSDSSFIRFKTEGASTKNAERIGWQMGSYYRKNQLLRRL